ncbi:MAG: hypothetical protein F4Z93_09885 [Rhodospirillales bacterium]|nr:hypothetical protein [Rhodospirillales bacterium]
MQHRLVGLQKAMQVQGKFAPARLLWSKMPPQQVGLDPAVDVPEAGIRPVDDLVGRDFRDDLFTEVEEARNRIGLGHRVGHGRLV